MEKLEGATARRDTTAAEQAEVSAATSAVTARRDAALGEITEATAKASDARAGIVAGMPADLLALYDKVRAAAGGIGAAMLRRGRCEGCRESLSMAELSENPGRRARRGDAARGVPPHPVRTPESGL